MFATDRDLVVIEPGLLAEAGWLGQRLAYSTDASVDSTGLVVSVPGAKLATAGVGAGHVVRIENATFEVVSVNSETEMVVSRLREDTDAPPIPGEAGTGLEVTVMTFRPQIALVHQQVLRMGGIGEAGVDPGTAVLESDVVNPSELVALEALGALHLIYAALSTGASSGGGALSKAERYRERFSRERRRAGIRVDLDGDGVADAVRRLNGFRMVRG